MPGGFTHIQEHRVAIIGWTKVVSIAIARKKFFPDTVLLSQNFQEMFSYVILRILAVVIQHEI